MTRVIRPSCWHKNFGLNRLSAPTLGICLNFFFSIIADFNISSALRWVIQDQWSSGNGGNDVSTFSQLLWIQSSSNLQVTRTDIKSLEGFEFRPDLTNHFGVMCAWVVKKWFIQLFSLNFDDKFAGKENRHKSANEFEFGPDRIIHFGVIRSWVRNLFPQLDLRWAIAVLLGCLFFSKIQILIRVSYCPSFLL